MSNLLESIHMYRHEAAGLAMFIIVLAVIIFIKPFKDE